MTRLHTIKKPTETTKGSCVFVHGLEGDALDTWKIKEAGNQSWPTLISNETSFADIAVYSVGYEAAATNLVGHTMPLFDRAGNILDILRTERVLDRPTVFIAHSLGGLVVKEIARLAHTQNVAEWNAVKNNLACSVFIGTPHQGASLPAIAETIFKLLGLSPILAVSQTVDELRRNQTPLRQLHEWFVNNAEIIRFGCCAYFETKKTYGIRVVDQNSATIGIPGSKTIGIDGDHFSIAKPAPGSPLYNGARDFVVETISSWHSKTVLPTTHSASPPTTQKTTVSISIETHDPVQIILEIRPGPAVPNHLIPQSVRMAFANATPSVMDAIALINQANEVVHQVEQPQSGKEHEYLLVLARLPQADVASLWFHAFSQACALGPRMVASLLVSAPANVRRSVGTEINAILSKLLGGA
jgi:hypothetical protein